MNLSFIQRYYNEYTSDLATKGFSEKPSFTLEKCQEWHDSYQKGLPVSADFRAFVRHAIQYLSFSAEELEHCADNPACLPWLETVFQHMGSHQLSVLNTCSYRTMSMLLPVLLESHYYRHNTQTSYRSYLSLILGKNINLDDIRQNVALDNPMWEKPLVMQHFIHEITNFFQRERDFTVSSHYIDMSYFIQVLNHHQSWDILNAYLPVMPAKNALFIALLYQNNPEQWLHAVQKREHFFEDIESLETNKELLIWSTLFMIQKSTAWASPEAHLRPWIEQLCNRYLKLLKLNKNLKEKNIFEYTIERMHALLEQWNVSSSLLNTMESLDMTLKPDDLVHMIYNLTPSEETTLMLE